MGGDGEEGRKRVIRHGRGRVGVFFRSSRAEWGEYVHGTGAGNITSHWLREYEVEKLRSPACCWQENAMFSPHIHANNGK